MGNFISIQSSHLVSTDTPDRSRIRTGYERTLAHHVGRDFAGVAEEDGTVTKIDNKLNLVEVTYTKSKRKDVFSFGHKYTAFEGFHVDHDIGVLVKQGQKVRKGDIITYNKGYFNVDRTTKQVDMSIGTMANVVLMELDKDIEDSSYISRRLANKLSFNPVNSRTVVLDKNSLIHRCAKVGDEIKSTDYLMTFEENAVDTGSVAKDKETLALLSDFNQRTPTAKHSGKIVRIEAYYGCPVKEMDATLQPIVKTAIDNINKAHKAAKGTISEMYYPESQIIPRGTKFKGVMFDENTVMLVFYIQEKISQQTGDKLVIMNQCKSVVGAVFDEPMYTESGIEVDVFFSAAAVSDWRLHTAMCVE